MKKQFAAWSSSVDVLSNTDEWYSALFQPIDDLDQISQASSEPVEFPNDERISFAGEIDGGFQTGSRTFRTGGDIFINFSATEFLQLVFLQT